MRLLYDFRGGCWGNSARNGRSTIRYMGMPGDPNFTQGFYLGFRPAFRLKRIKR